MTPVHYIRQSWERSWTLRVARDFDAAGPNDALRALRLFEPQVLHQALPAGPRLPDILAAARWIQGLARLSQVSERARPAVCRTTDARWIRPRAAPLRPSHRRVIIHT